jgi:hypothetical protein
MPTGTTQLLAQKGNCCYVYSIDIQGMANNNLVRIENNKKVKVNYITAKADDAMNVLYNLLCAKLKKEKPGTILFPISRHEIISNCMTYKQATDSTVRFKTEVVLQTLKSRGFITIDSISEIERIRRFADNANSDLNDLCREGILCTNTCTAGFSSSEQKRGFLLLQNSVGFGLHQVPGE